MHQMFLSTITTLFFLLYYCKSDLSEPLRDAASQTNVWVGSEASYGYLQSDSTYNSVLAKEYNLITAGNACKWFKTEPSQNEFDYTQCDYVYNYGQTNSQIFRGHNLCWGEDNPSWLTNGGFSSSQLKSILENHIINVMQHYYKNGKNVYCWDVVNEAVSDSPSTNNIYKDNVWYPDVPNYVDLAFEYAKIAIGNSSNVKLFYNDYNILMSSGWMQTKSDTVYNMIKTMKSNGIPIDGVGFQAHVSLNDYPLDYNSILSNIQRYDSLGIEVHITELDVDCECNGNLSQDVLTKQAETYTTILRACLASSNCKSFESWGFTDKYTWLSSGSDPLPFDSNFNPKTAAYDILSVYINSTKIN